MLEISKGQGYEPQTRIGRFLLRIRKFFGKRRSRKVTIPLLILLVALLVGLGSWYYFSVYRQSADETKIDQNDPYAKSIQRLEKGPVPKDPMDRAVYYSQIAENYETLKAHDQALEYYLKAQQAIDEGNLSQSLAFYRAIGDIYAEKHDKSHAKEYYRKELARLQQYKKDHPDDPGTDAVIKDVQKAVNKQ